MCTSVTGDSVCALQLLAIEFPTKENHAHSQQTSYITNNVIQVASLHYPGYKHFHSVRHSCNRCPMGVTIILPATVLHFHDTAACFCVCDP